MEFLPEECIAAILSRTTPVDVARLSVVSKTFCSAANSDVVWKHFLPSEFKSIVSQSPSLANAPSKKALYLALSDHPIIIYEGKKSLQLDKKSGKKCYMLGVRDLFIASGDDERYWCYWKNFKGSRFPEVAKLRYVWWLGIRGMINTHFLSPNTQYGAFLVFKIKHYSYEFRDYPVELSLKNVCSGQSMTKNVCLWDPYLDGRRPHYRVEGLQCPSVRSDGWLEIEMGEFFNSGLEDEDLQMSVTEMQDYKSGLILEGIEVRPKKHN
ncbi:F-box protein PP2-B11-like [Lotus japonicus]|uniref:F-box protein PP2-B11-like n=1 Tax=Lotus japonicus TaxID=34305 RepID=UPI0025876599|nr:F-box protein PP2-B11-like [Lotus japonicus]